MSVYERLLFADLIKNITNQFYIIYLYLAFEPPAPSGFKFKFKHLYLTGDRHVEYNTVRMMVGEHYQAISSVFVNFSKLKIITEVITGHFKILKFPS